MRILIWSVASLYVLGFLAVFVLNLNIGPVTPALAFVRAAVWPLWITTGVATRRAGSDGLTTAI